MEHRSEVPPIDHAAAVAVHIAKGGRQPVVTSSVQSLTEHRDNLRGSGVNTHKHIAYEEKTSRRRDFPMVQKHCGVGWGEWFV